MIGIEALVSERELASLLAFLSKKILHVTKKTLVRMNPRLSIFLVGIQLNCVRKVINVNLFKRNTNIRIRIIRVRL